MCILIEDNATGLVDLEDAMLIQFVHKLRRRAKLGYIFYLLHRSKLNKTSTQPKEMERKAFRSISSLP